ncbi:hypothetical protein ACKE81_003557, partial [Klebsiella pneumoniae]
PRRDAVIVTLFAAVSFILPAVFLNSPAVAAMRRKSWKALRKAKKLPSRLAAFCSRLSAR